MSVLRYSEVFGKKSGLYEINLEEIGSYCLQKATESPRKRCLMLLHEGDFETGHRFINALLPDTELSIHRHTSPLQTELYLPIKGTAFVISFDDVGEVNNSYRLDGRSPTLIEIKPNTWHTIIALTPFVMFEMKGQPENYDPQKDKEFAPWAPKEGDSGFKEYQSALKKSLIA